MYVCMYVCMYEHTCRTGIVYTWHGMYMHVQYTGTWHLLLIFVSNTVISLLKFKFWRQSFLHSRSRSYQHAESKYVTGLDLGKHSILGFFQKIEFDAWLISSSIELTRVQALDRSCASLLRYSALFAIASHAQ